MKPKSNWKVILIVIEDLTSHAAAQVRTPSLDILIEAGSSTLEADPAATRPGANPLVGILTSTESLKNGIHPNEAAALSDVRYNIVNLASLYGRSTAGYYSISRLGDLFRSGSFDQFYCPTHECIKGDPHNIVVTAASDIVACRPDFCFIYFSSFEHVGCRPELMSPKNLKHIEKSDRGLELLLNAMSLFGLFGDYHILLTGDLSGLGTAPDGNGNQERRIPWLAFGPRIRRGYSIRGEISVLDTTPTVARLMNLPRLPSWEGNPVDEIIRDVEEEQARKSMHETTPKNDRRELMNSLS